MLAVIEPSEEQAIARLVCPGCGDWLAPASALGATGEAERDLRCLGCDTDYPWRDGVLDFGFENGPVVRNFKLGKKAHSFLGLLRANLKMARNSDRTFQDEIYAMLSWLDLAPSHTVLLLGCGEGQLLAPIAQAIDPGVLIAVESDVKQLCKARDRCAEKKIYNAVLCRADITNPPVRPGSFDRLVLCGVLHGPEPATDCVVRSATTLRSDGVLVGLALARSILPRIAQQQERFGQSLGARFIDVNSLGRDLCRGDFSAFQLDQPSNWMARFVARKL